jgi:hypothetical protein
MTTVSAEQATVAHLADRGCYCPLNDRQAQLGLHANLPMMWGILLTCSFQLVPQEPAQRAILTNCVNEKANPARLCSALLVGLWPGLAWPNARPRRAGTPRWGGTQSRWLAALINAPGSLVSYCTPPYPPPVVRRFCGPLPYRTPLRGGATECSALNTQARPLVCLV